MGEGLNISRGVGYQAPIQVTDKADDIKLQESKTEAQPAYHLKEKPVSDPSKGKLEQSINGAARQAALNGQLPKEPTESIKAAQKILDNPKLSNEAKIAELQKTIAKTDKTEFANFVSKLSNFSDAQKELIHSAFTESPKLMERVARELKPAEQLSLVKNAVMHPSVGKTEKEEAKRLERFDNGIAAWMENTDMETLNNALDAKHIDIRASAKLLGVLAHNPNRLIMRMGHDEGKIIGDNYAMATDLMNLVLQGSPDGKYSRDDVEKFAITWIMERSRVRHERNVLVFEP